MFLSMLSAWTIGAMASKKASESSPVSRWIASASGLRGQRPGGDDDVLPFGRRQAGDLAALDGDVGVAVDGRGDGIGEADAVDRQRAAGRQLVRIGLAHDQRTAAPHFLVQQADGIVLVVVGAEAVGADELGEALREVGLGHALGPHFVEHDPGAGFRRLPGRFGAGEAAADDVDGLGI